VLLASQESRRNAEWEGCSDYAKRHAWNGLMFALQSEDRVPIHDLSPCSEGGILPPQIERIVWCQHLFGTRENP
jgi:hypothetical protein